MSFAFINMTYWGFPMLLLSLFVQPDKYETERQQMVANQIEARGVRNKVVLEAMKKVPRHLFVPGHYQHLAYNDRALPIGMGQTISQPYVVAFMTEAIAPQPEFKVLEIGTGSGYQAAILAEMVEHVYTIELVEVLAERSEALLDDLNYANIDVKCADGYAGWEEHAPYDAIIVTAAADSVPPPLIEQLKIGGRMVIPVNSKGEFQQLKLIVKSEHHITTKNLLPVRFVPFIHREK